MLYIRKGDVCISDYGMLQVMAELSQKSVAFILNDAKLTRWTAPEMVVLVSLPATNTACDVWSFGMTMLELFTMDRPWAELKREAHVHRAMGDGDKPARPKSCHGLTDHIWTVMVECWERHAINRPAMGTVTSNIQCEDSQDFGHGPERRYRTQKALESRVNNICAIGQN